jgi:ribosomal protein S18 acetylase RimI-like enzyme
MRRRATLGLLLTGKPNPDAPAIDHFVSFTRANRLPLELLWHALRTDASGRAPDDADPLAASLVVPSPGGLGMVFVNPLSRPEQLPAAAAAVQTACDDAATRLPLLQALLDTDQHDEAQAMLHGGLRVLTTLVYMQRRLRSGEPRIDLLGAVGPRLAVRQPGYGQDRPLRLVCWAEAHRPLFAEALRQSYDGTLDCPGLTGLRSMDQVIAGHQSTGVFDPRSWWVLAAGDQPVAVLLLARLAEGTSVELVYLGVSARCRGLGVAKLLVRFALHRAVQVGGRRMVLAVDEANGPARALYSGLGFRVASRKQALIRADGASAGPRLRPIGVV